MPQLDDAFRVDFDLLRDHPGYYWDRPERVNFGIALPEDVLEAYAIKQGFYNPEVEYQTEKVHLEALCAGLQKVQQRLVEAVGRNARYPAVRIDSAELEGYDPFVLMLVFYDNYTPVEGRLSEADERWAIEFLQQELELTWGQAKPLWYFQYEKW